MNSIQGIDMDEGVRRTGNQADLYIRFLKRFPDDQSLSAISDALTEGRIHDAFVCSHMLKGLTAQLGITALHEPISALCELLRNEDAAVSPEARRQLDALMPTYREIVRRIRALS